MLQEVHAEGPVQDKHPLEHTEINTTMHIVQPNLLFPNKINLLQTMKVKVFKVHHYDSKNTYMKPNPRKGGRLNTWIKLIEYRLQ